MRVDGEVAQVLHAPLHAQLAKVDLVDEHDLRLDRDLRGLDVELADDAHQLLDSVRHIGDDQRVGLGVGLDGAALALQRLEHGHHVLRRDEVERDDLGDEIDQLLGLGQVSDRVDADDPTLEPDLEPVGPHERDQRLVPRLIADVGGNQHVDDPGPGYDRVARHLAESAHHGLDVRVLEGERDRRPLDAGQSRLLEVVLDDRVVRLGGGRSHDDAPLGGHDDRLRDRSRRSRRRHVRSERIGGVVERHVEVRPLLVHRIGGHAGEREVEPHLVGRRLADDGVPHAAAIDVVVLL